MQIFLIYFTWCKNINKTLKGRGKSENYSDTIKIMAKKKYADHKKTIPKIKATKNNYIISRTDI